MESSYKILISKLDEFIRKYYKNQLVRGVLYSVALGLSFYISLAATAYYSYSYTLIRAIIFYLFLTGNIFILTRYIIIPLLKLYRIGNVISYEDASMIIGKHFREVQDKLLNILQLKRQLTVSDEITGETGMASFALIEAGIEQKIKDIRPVPFSIAVDISENKKYIPYAAIPIIVLLLTLWIKPLILRQGTKQMIHYETVYARQAPFAFTIENNNLTAVEQKDFTLKLKLTGKEAPDEVFINYEGSVFKMEKLNPVSFQYIFRNVQHSIDFSFSAAGYESEGYRLNAIPNPSLLNFEVKLHYPPYTKRADETLHNIGDLSVPQGTVANWSFNTRNTDNMHLHFADTALTLIPSGKNIFAYSRRLMQSQNYSISASNSYIASQDSVRYAIQVIPDLYPSIDVENQDDSLSSKQLYFNGTVKDDYGFTRLAFIFRIFNQDDTAAKSGVTHTVELDISKNVLAQPFYYYWNLDTLNLWPGQQIEYYFEVWDNDQVNGNKGTKSNLMYYKIPSLEEIDKTTDKNSDKVESEISNTIQQAFTLQNQMEQTRTDMFNKQELNWADKKKVKDMLQKQLDLQEKMKEMAKENKENNQKQWDYKKKDSSLAQKQEELQKLFDQLASDSLKKKFAELQKMLDKMNKDQVQQQLDKLSQNDQDLKKELERTLDLFKQLEFEQKLSENIQRLDSLASKQQQLSKESKDVSSSKGTKQAQQEKNGELEKKQDGLNNDFKDISKNLNELEKKNNNLESPTSFKNPAEQEQKIEEQQQNSSDQLSKSQSSKASQSQQNASQQMQQMSEQLQSMQQQSEDQQEQANTESLRRILNNLVSLSFAQEDLMKQTSAENGHSMQFARIAKNQKELQDKASTIEDSLYELSKRAPQIQGIVNQQISDINHNMVQSIKEMEERQGFEAAGNQQYSMTSINNLALMLSEVLNSLQSQMNMKNHTPGNGSCNKPGGMGNKVSMSQIRKMQEQLSQQMSQMKNAMEKNGQKSGDKQGDEKMNEQLAKMAAEQEFIRSQMQDAEDEIDRDKKGGAALGNVAKEMDETKNDILNQQITEATLERQQEIIKHLLEYEKSERTQGQEPDFESHVAKKQYFGNQNPFFQYNMQKTQQDELLKTIPLDLNKFYQNKVNQYFNSFQE